MRVYTVSNGRLIKSEQLGTIVSCTLAGFVFDKVRGERNVTPPREEDTQGVVILHLILKVKIFVRL